MSENAVISENPEKNKPVESQTDEKNTPALEPMPFPADSSVPFSPPPPVNPPAENVVDNSVPVTASDPAPAPEPPRGRGRHPKGCKCGRCIQSGGTGGYEKGGAKPPVNGSRAASAENPDFSDILGQTAQATGTDYGALASLFFDTGTGIATTIFGNEWQAKSPEEKQMVCGPLAVYLKSRGMTDLPPGVVLSIVCLAYSAPRLQAPSTKQKLGMWWLWIKSKIFRKKGII